MCQLAETAPHDDSDDNDSRFSLLIFLYHFMPDTLGARIKNL